MREKVLLVEADSKRRGAVRDALAAGGLTVIEASSTTDAMQQVRDDPVSGLVIADESRVLALKGLCSIVRRNTADARVFILLHSDSDSAKLAGAVEGAQLIEHQSSPEQIAMRVLASFGARTPEVWRYVKTRPIRRSKLWEVHAAKNGAEEVMLAHLSEQFARDDELRGEFIQAARETAQLVHPNLPRVLSVGGADDIPFVVTELRSGATLQELRRRARGDSKAPGANGESGFISPRTAAFIASEVAAALERAHGAARVHGAVSPETVWISSEGQVQLLHLGIAGLCSMLERSMRSTMGMAIPQPYLAPEQITQNQTDVRTDAFLVGIVLYELLARRPLFLRDNATLTREAILETKIGELGREVPEKIAEVAMSCLEKNPAFRPQTAASLRAKLLAAIEDGGPAGRAAPAPDPVVEVDEDGAAPAGRGFFGRLFSGGAGVEESESAASLPAMPAPAQRVSPREELAAICARLR